MAYRVECNKTVKEFYENLVNFLTNPVSFDEPDYSNAQGNGNIENINFNYDNAKTEDWVLTYDATNNKFTVSGTISGNQDDAYIDQPYDNGIISFTIRQGDVEWQDGDTVIIKAIKSSNPPFKLINKGVYRKELKAEINGTYGYTIYNNSCGYTINNKVNNSDFIGFQGNLEYNSRCFSYSRAAIYCNSIDTNHKLNNVDFTVSWTHQNAAIYNSSIVWLHNFTSNNITSETTKTISINHMDKTLSVLDTTFDISSYVDTIDDLSAFTHYVFRCDISDGSFELFANGSSILSGTVNDLAGGSFRIYQFQPTNSYSFYYWARKLTDNEILELYNNNSFPTENINDYYASLLNNKAFYPYIVVATNKYGYLFIDDNGIRFNPVCSSMWEDTPAPADENIPILSYYNHYNNEYYYSYTNQYFDIGDINDKIAKYWIIQDGTNILLAFKLIDYTKIDHPVYQLFYIGWGEGDVAFDYPMAIGMKSSPFNWWETDDDNYRFGLMYNDNISVWDGYRWTNNLVTDGALSDDWSNIINDPESVSVTVVNKYRNLKDNVEIISYGVPKWLYMLNYATIAPESEVYIDETKYVVIPDNVDKQPYKYLIKLEA